MAKKQLKGTDRLRGKMMEMVKQGQKTLATVSMELGISYRQVKRIYQRYLSGGDEALVHGNKGKPSNNKTDWMLLENVLSLYKEYYSDSGENDLLSHAKIFALTHHEKWDGTGYPNGLQGNKIPLQGRIMAIVDVFDALVSERPYKKAFAHEEAVKMIIDEKGKQFDPLLIDLFIHISNDFKNYSFWKFP